MAGQFRPWGWTVRYISAKCLLDTSVLVPKCPDTSDPPEQCRSVPGPKCPVAVRIKEMSYKIIIKMIMAKLETGVGG